MWTLFKRKRPSKLQVAAAGHLRRGILKLQELCALKLSALERKLSWRTKKMLLLLFCLLFAGASALTMFSALWPAPTISDIHIQRIPRPILSRPAPEPQLGSDEKEAVTAFRRIIDSLEKTPEGRLALDSLRHVRPGLLDSFLTIEKMIYQK